jgi:monoamine oxidase
MAKTPLLSSIKKFLKEYHTSQQLGLPLDAVRERSEKERHIFKSKSISRRQFITGLAATSATMMLPAFLKRTSKAAPKPHIAIIGGGLAGLTAALTLADAGVTATIYEASETTIGGRMLTVRGTSGNIGCALCHDLKGKGDFFWDEGQYTDPFGELIDSTHPTMLALVKRFKLPLIDLIAA